MYMHSSLKYFLTNAYTFLAIVKLEYHHMFVNIYYYKSIYAVYRTV